MAQALKYQETKVAVDKTLTELTGLIKSYGGTRFEQSWTPNGRVGEVRFAVQHDTLGELPVRLTARTAKIEHILLEAGLWKSYPKDERKRMISGQAERIAWRHIKDLTEQLLLAVQLDIKTLPEAFLADVEIHDTQLGEPVRMAEFLERRAEGGPEGLVLEGVADDRRVIPMPPTQTGEE